MSSYPEVTGFRRFTKLWTQMYNSVRVCVCVVCLYVQVCMFECVLHFWEGEIHSFHQISKSKETLL